MKLETEGFYRHCENADVAQQARKESLRTGKIYPPEIRRTHPMDPQKMSWAGVADFLTSAKPLFDLRKVDLGTPQQVTMVGDAYYVFAGGKEFQIYSEAETYLEEHQQLAVKRTLEMCNELLKEAGSDEQVYFLYSGKQGMAVFLTSKQYEIIQGSPGIPPHEKPLTSQNLPKQP